MSGDTKASSEYGPGKFRALFERGLDFALDRLIRRAETAEGGLSAAEIREEIERFKTDPDTDISDYFDDAWRECTFTIERLHWDQKRRYPFQRLMVNTFVHLLPTGDQVAIPGQHISRRVIPGFVIAMTQMLGEELADKYQQFCQSLVSQLKTQHGNNFNWEMVYSDPVAIEVVSEVLITICHHFVNLKKRRRWLTDVVNGHMGAPTAVQDIPFEAMECHRLISAMFQSLRDTMKTSKGEERIAVQFGHDRVKMLQVVFAQITRDHRELSLGLNSPPNAV